LTAVDVRRSTIGGEGPPSLTADDIARLVHGTVQGAGATSVSGIAPLDRAAESDLSFLASAQYTTEFLNSAAGVVLVTPFLLPAAPDLLTALRAASASQWLLVLVIGLFATSGHLFLILAYGFAPTTTLMPFVYTQIAFALVASWIAFRHVPDAWAWFGMGVIALCGGASAWLNVRAGPPRAHPDSAVAADTIAD